MSNIKQHIKKYAETKTYNMRERDKRELQAYYGQIFPKEKKLNIRCSACVAKALKRLANFKPEKEEVENTSNDSNSLKDMNMPELRELAKELGIKIPRSKADLIHNIINNVKA